MSMQRIHSFAKPTQRIDQQYEREIAQLERLVPSHTPSDAAAAGASEAQRRPMSHAEIQQANPPPTPPGVKREGVGGYVYPKSFEVL